MQFKFHQLLFLGIVLLSGAALLIFDRPEGVAIDSNFDEYSNEYLGALQPRWEHLAAQSSKHQQSISRSWEASRHIMPTSFEYWPPNHNNRNSFRRTSLPKRKRIYPADHNLATTKQLSAADMAEIEEIRRRRSENLLSPGGEGLSCSITVTDLSGSLTGSTETIVSENNCREISLLLQVISEEQK